MRSRSLATSTLFLSSRKETSPEPASGIITRNAERIPINSGSATRRMLMTRSWLLPGAAQTCRALRTLSAASDMREDVDLGPAGQVEIRAGGQEIEAGLGQSRAALAGEAAVEFFAQPVQETHVGCGIVLL